MALFTKGKKDLSSLTETSVERENKKWKKLYEYFLC